MTAYDNIAVPHPVIDAREAQTLARLNERFEELMRPGVLSRAKQKLIAGVPQSLRQIGEAAEQIMLEQKLYVQGMKALTKGFAILEQYAARFTIGEKAIIEKVNAVSGKFRFRSLDELCLARSYELAKLVNKYKGQCLALALAEGSTTACMGLVGVPFGMTLTALLYYRSVQSIAMHYGYDVKNDSAELVIAGNVFLNALSPGSGELRERNEVAASIAKLMLMAQLGTLRQMSKKSWKELAQHGGGGILLYRIRALAYKHARRVLEQTGKKGLEESIFRGVYQQLGKLLAKRWIKRAVPVAGAAIGALFDVKEMNEVLEYADIFYHKRYLLEKETRIQALKARSRLFREGQEGCSCKI